MTADWLWLWHSSNETGERHLSLTPGPPPPVGLGLGLGLLASGLLGCRVVDGVCRAPCACGCGVRVAGACGVPARAPKKNTVLSAKPTAAAAAGPALALAACGVG
jgi:hypothetical protein